MVEVLKAVFKWDKTVQSLSTDRNEPIEMSGALGTVEPKAEPAADVALLFDVTDSEDKALGFGLSGSGHTEEVTSGMQVGSYKEQGDEEEEELSCLVKRAWKGTTPRLRQGNEGLSSHHIKAYNPLTPWIFSQISFAVFRSLVIYLSAS